MIRLRNIVSAVPLCKSDHFACEVLRKDYLGARALWPRAQCQSMSASGPILANTSRRCDNATDGGCIVRIFLAPDIVSSAKLKAIPSIDLFLEELMPYELIEKLQQDLVGAQRAGSSQHGSSLKVLASACFEFERLPSVWERR